VTDQRLRETSIRVTVSHDVARGELIQSLRPAARASPVLSLQHLLEAPAADPEALVLLLQTLECGERRIGIRRPVPDRLARRTRHAEIAPAAGRVPGSVPLELAIWTTLHGYSSLLKNCCNYAKNFLIVGRVLKL